MSNPQNKPMRDIEVVARKLCRFAGYLPEDVDCYYEDKRGRIRYIPCWHAYKPEARQILLALKRNRGK